MSISLSSISISMAGVEAGDLAGKKRVSGELIAQGGEDFAGARFVFLPHISDGQQDARKRSQVVAVRSGNLQVGEALIFVAGHAAQAQDPAHRGCHAADDVLAETRSHAGVRAVGVYGEKLFGPNGSLLS